MAGNLLNFSPLVTTLECGIIRASPQENCYGDQHYCALLAQLAEHLTLNQRVDGSSPSGSILGSIFGRCFVVPSAFDRFQAVKHLLLWL